ncbi:AraC family transcriptional regulator [Chryseobacterium arthrosphaerae]|uniref:helix-turn-helix domain-containing protein n=1 Tax=Chryseobacterium arthrosphaerae TaxID=651561 RepID=UPI000F4FE8EB|nr:AraC family transcriptional regulator [Chryseobacterium arthrosphaerae]AYZ12771.1 AraC family transcriptional regulator [Chryseobacterium arthrosphaerae]
MKKKAILQKLKEFEKEERYLDKKISLSALSSSLNTNNTYLSELINRDLNKNFSAYINELRVFYIIKKLEQNPKYRNYKISTLADESGFISHSAFSIIFKKIIGMPPSDYIKALKYNILQNTD